MRARNRKGQFISRGHRRRRRSYRRNPESHRERVTAAHRGWRHRRRRHHYRRNPLLGRDLMTGVLHDVAGGAGVTGGRILAKTAVSLTKQDPTSWLGIGISGGSGILLGRVLRRQRTRGVLGSLITGAVFGAVNVAFEAALAKAAPTIAAKLLGEYPVIPGYPGGIGMGAYAMAPALPAGTPGGLYEGMHPALMGAYETYPY